MGCIGDDRHWPQLMGHNSGHDISFPFSLAIGRALQGCAQSQMN